MSEENINYLNFLSTLGEKILSDPSVAQSFSADPQKFIKENGFENIMIDLDESFLKIIIALGDEEVVGAVKDGDFKRFIRLCKERNLLQQSERFKREDLVSQTRSIVNGDLELVDGDELMGLVFVFAVMLIAGFGVLVVAFAINFGTKVTGINGLGQAIEQNDAFQVWALLEQNISMFIFEDDEIQYLIDVCEEYYEALDLPADRKEEVINNIRYNLVKMREYNEE